MTNLEQNLTVLNWQMFVDGYGLKGKSLIDQPHNSHSKLSCWFYATHVIAKYILSIRIKFVETFIFYFLLGGTKPQSHSYTCGKHFGFSFFLAVNHSFRLIVRANWNFRWKWNTIQDQIRRHTVGWGNIIQDCSE